MKKKGRRTIIIALAAVLIAGIFMMYRIVSAHPGQRDLDTSGSLVSLTQNGDTIVFNPDGTYIIQGDVEIQGITFSYETQGTYSVIDGKLVLNEENPTVSVVSKFGNFELPGSIHSEISDGALIIQLEASNESGTFELAFFTLGNKEADTLGITGVKAESWEDQPGNEEKQDDISVPDKATEPDTSDALLVVESAGNKIAFLPDGIFVLLAQFTQSDDGLTVTFDYTLNDRYTVEDGKLTLPKETAGLLNSDLMASYGYTDVETPTKCTVEIVDGLLEVRFSIQTADGEKEIAVFKIGKEDAEKIGVQGITGETVIEEKEVLPAPQSADNAPAQPSVSGDAKPLSFSNGGYTITFYSNGQYRESGSVNAGGTVVSVTVTDTYSIDGSGSLSIHTGNQVSCYASMGGYDVSFGAPNNTSCSGGSGGYTIRFNVPANGQTYHVGTVTLSADDVKRIQKNFGLQGEKPEPAPKPTPEPTADPKPKPSPEPDEQTDEETILLKSEAGIDLIFYPAHKTFDLKGKSVLGNMELAAYNLIKQGTYKIQGNTLIMDPVTMKITALHEMAKPLEGEVEMKISVSKGDNSTLVFTLPIGDPPVSYSMTKEQAKKIGIDPDTYQEISEEETSPYTPDNEKTQITFMKEYGAFSISGAGKFAVNGMEADLQFSMADTYTAGADDAVTAANTADALSYTVTMFGQSQEAKATPSTTIVREGDSYKVTLKAEVNGQSITLCEGTVPAEEVIQAEEETSPYTPDNEKTVITFMKEYGAFSISGAGKFAVNGMEADLQFSMADTYTAGDDAAVTAANTADALSYTVTMFGQSQEAKATPSTTIVREGDSYKVTLKAEVNGQSITLCEGTVPAEEVIQAEEETTAISYTALSQNVSFDKDAMNYSADGQGTMSAMGMDIPVTFTITDKYQVSENESITVSNTSGTLHYTCMGAEGTTDPVTVITKENDTYHVKIQAVINGTEIILLDQKIAVEKIMPESNTLPLKSISEPVSETDESDTIPVKESVDAAEEIIAPEEEGEKEEAESQPDEDESCDQKEDIDISDEMSPNEEETESEEGKTSAETTE